MNQRRILEFIHEASQTFAMALMLMWKGGVVGMDARWLDWGCDPTQHMTDLLKVLETQSVAGMHFLACGCIVVLTNEHVYVNGCNDQHKESYTGADIARMLLELDPEHYDDPIGGIENHPIPFSLEDEENPRDRLQHDIRWENFMNAVKDIEFDFGERDNG
tara:strand:+ start:414 stop:896 length:483 start_codon:yes stop_codon:yes gene_type:complete